MLWIRGGWLLGWGGGWGCTRERVAGRDVGVLPEVKLDCALVEVVRRLSWGYRGGRWVTGAGTEMALDDRFVV